MSGDFREGQKLKKRTSCSTKLSEALDILYTISDLHPFLGGFDGCFFASAISVVFAVVSGALAGTNRLYNEISLLFFELFCWLVLILDDLRGINQSDSGEIFGLDFDDSSS